MAESIVEARGLRKSFRGRQVLKGVDIEIHEREVVGLVGLNGSGKSTLLKILACAVAPDAGHGRACGVALGGSRSPVCGYMMEHPPFIENFSGLQNLLALADMSGTVTRSEVEATLRRVCLDPGDRTHVRRFSQGMRQRLGLAQALMEKPPLLLLDEPLNGLDPSGILDVRRIISESAAQGATVLFSSHVLSEVQRLCDRVLVLNDGVIIELGGDCLSTCDALESAYRDTTGYARA